MIDLLEIDGFLDDATLGELLDELRRAGGRPATVLRISGLRSSSRPYECPP